MQKTIIVYSSVDGHTKEICQKIASQLEDQVDIVSVDDNPMVEEYDHIILVPVLGMANTESLCLILLTKIKIRLIRKKMLFFL